MEREEYLCWTERIYLLPISLSIDPNRLTWTCHEATLVRERQVEALGLPRLPKLLLAAHPTRGPHQLAAR